MTVNIVSVNIGLKYDMAYVAILHDMVRRNATLAGELKHWCVTDRPEELPPGIDPIKPVPGLPGWWQKVALFSPQMPWPPGARVAYFDLDVAITGRLEDLLETPGIMRDPLWPCFNSSVMVWNDGEHREVWSKFDPTIMDAPGRVVPPECLPQGQVNGGDQEWITEVSREAQETPWRAFPSEWCVSYREGALAWPPDGCKVVIFNGQPKPEGIEGGWVPEVWKIGGFTSLPEMRGVNVTHEAILDNVRVNSARDLPWFTGFGEHNGVAVVVAGGPSMKDNLPEIRAHQKRGARIITVNNAWRTLLAAGIKPFAHVMLDARAENAEFVKDAPEGVRYLLASQAHPDVFDALGSKEIVVWHNAFGDSAELRDVLEPWWDGPNQKPIILVPGGGTVGLRALWLCAFSGFRTVHVYGMDSSYEGKLHHAYAQPLNDADAVMEVAMGDKRYLCARWMVRQAEEFKQTWADLMDEGVVLHVHGRGLIPDIARQLRREVRAA